MRIEAVTLLRAKRFDVELPGRKFGLRAWLAVQAIGLAVMLVGTVSADTVDEGPR